jgi:NhaA family Na+:H+ antiporter
MSWSPSNVPPGASPTAHRIAYTLLHPVNRLLKHDAITGLLLLAAGVIALAWANSPWSASYAALWETPLQIGAGSGTIQVSLQFVVNDVLMAIFFFAIGLEVRRELHNGELSSIRRAALPVFAAVGGMIVPAAIYLAIAGARVPHGWGVPVATDIAFAIGILALLGNRVPPSLRILLLALAIIDDIGAILIIAVFYSQGVAMHGIALALAGMAAILILQRFGMRASVGYVVPAVLIWVGIYEAGVHPTIAGVIVGLMTPAVAWEGREQVAPAERIEHALHPWVNFAIMPIFALANAGVDFRGIELTVPTLAVGVALALVVGKPAGVMLASMLAVRLRLAALPSDLGWRGVALVAVLAGIGFTMALFIAQLAFAGQSDLHRIAKLAVLVGSAIAALAALALGSVLYRRVAQNKPS